MATHDIVQTASPTFKTKKGADNWLIREAKYAAECGAKQEVIKRDGGYVVVWS